MSVTDVAHLEERRFGHAPRDRQERHRPRPSRASPVTGATPQPAGAVVMTHVQGYRLDSILARRDGPVGEDGTQGPGRPGYSKADRASSPSSHLTRWPLGRCAARAGLTPSADGFDSLAR